MLLIWQREVLNRQSTIANSYHEGRQLGYFFLVLELQALVRERGNQLTRVSKPMFEALATIKPRIFTCLARTYKLGTVASAFLSYLAHISTYRKLSAAQGQLACSFSIKAAELERKTNKSPWLTMRRRFTRHLKFNQSHRGPKRWAEEDLPDWEPEVLIIGNKQLN